MKRRVPKCCVLTGWEDSKEMTIPRKCGQEATHLHATYRLPVCKEHVKANAARGFTLVPPSGPWIGSGKGSSYDRIG